MSPLRRRDAVVFAAVLAGVCLLARQALGAEPGIAGLWRTIDDRSGAPRSEVRLEMRGADLVGRVVRLLQPGDAPDALCVACKGERRNQPIVGLLILTGMRPSAADPLHWYGGEILDPETGAIYRAQLQLDESGRRLTVRGFIGLPLVGRSQTWLRIE